MNDHDVHDQKNVNINIAKTMRFLRNPSQWMKANMRTNLKISIYNLHVAQCKDKIK